MSANWRPLLAVLAAVSTTTLAACASDHGAGAVAEQLLAAASSGDGAAACSLLSPRTRSELEESSGKPCEEAILEEQLTAEEPVTVSVFETSAQVRFPTSAVFLARFDSGWRVVAAACTPVPNQPYDCSVQGV
ncbi:MAG TPA: hypothetical protein VD814_11685 [Nocardioides sp.]|nr:hypothetical protein [Nocardioides sp.]